MRSETADIVRRGRPEGAASSRSATAGCRPIARRADLCFEIKDAEFRQFRSLTASLCLAQTLVISYAYQYDAPATEASQQA